MCHSSLLHFADILAYLVSEIDYCAECEHYYAHKIIVYYHETLSSSVIYLQ